MTSLKLRGKGAETWSLWMITLMLGAGLLAPWPVAGQETTPAAPSQDQPQAQESGQDPGKDAPAPPPAGEGPPPPKDAPGP